MTPERLKHIAQDRKNAIDATVDRWCAAYAQAHTPSRRPSRAGRVSGHGDAAITYSDPVGQTAAMLGDHLDKIANEMHYRRQDDYQLAKLLEEFAPARHWDNGMRRCTEEGCAKAHKALGLCDQHYQEQRRISERNRSRAG